MPTVFGILFLILLFALAIRLSKKANVKTVTLEKKEKDKLSQMYVNSSEEFVVSLGNSYLINFLVNNSLSSAFAVVTNKRLYFKGQAYFSKNGKLRREFEEKVVDVEDITGTSFKHTDALFYLIITVITFILWAVSFLVLPSVEYGGAFAFVIIPMVFYLIYKIKNKSYLEITFAGGSIAFDASIYAKEEIEHFQKLLRRSKENQKIVKDNIPKNENNSVADELNKYVELLNSGMISESEYNTLKENMIKNKL